MSVGSRNVQLLFRKSKGETEDGSTGESRRSSRGNGESSKCCDTKAEGGGGRYRTATETATGRRGEESGTREAKAALRG